MLEDRSRRCPRTVVFCFAPRYFSCSRFRDVAGELAGAMPSGLQFGSENWKNFDIKQ